VTKLEDQDSTGLEARCRAGNERNVDVGAVVASEESGLRFVVANFALQALSIGAPNVWGITGDQIETGGSQITRKLPFVRNCIEQTARYKLNTVEHGVPRGVAASHFESG
jgi:hypothetical protein